MTSTPSPPGAASTVTPPTTLATYHSSSWRYFPPQLDDIENVEGYEPGGLHPVSLGDILGGGRYAVIHKLGFGGFSTVWLARDLHTPLGGLVAVKVLRADASATIADVLPEVAISRHLRPILPHPSPILFVDDHFTVDGPNGSHTCLALPLAGPSVLGMVGTYGDRRLREGLAKRAAQQTAAAVYLLHSNGVVHGDLTTANILFRLSPQVLGWSDAQVYAELGTPETGTVYASDGGPGGVHAPEKLVAPIPTSKWANLPFLEENVVIGDFGQSYLVSSPPPGYEPGTAYNYLAPETRFEFRAGPEADIWALGCAIFELRAGFPLFESFFGSDVDVLQQTVQTLGRLPDPWWAQFEDRLTWFEESGELKSDEAQKRAGVEFPISASSVRDKVRSIGRLPIEHRTSRDDGLMMEPSVVPLDEREVDLLSDLLERMLKYQPEERISASDVLNHPWFITKLGYHVDL